MSCLINCRILSFKKRNQSTKFISLYVNEGNRVKIDDQKEINKYYSMKNKEKNELF